MEIDRLWRNSRSAALTGVPTGSASGLAAIDIDPRHGGHLWLMENWHRLPQGRIHVTIQNGWHMIFRHPAGLRSRKYRDGVEIKAEDRYIIWPTDEISWGYRVLSEGPLSDFPGWIIDELEELRSTPSSFFGAPLMNGAKERKELPPDLYFKVCRLVNPRFPLKAKRRVCSVLAVTVHKPEGDRNHALYWTVRRLAEFVDMEFITRKSAEELAFDAGMLCGLEPKKVLASINSAFIGHANDLSIRGAPKNYACTSPTA
jgi:hypothetical protein